MFLSGVQKHFSFAIFSLLAASHLLAQEALDYDMNPKEKKQTGLYKLTAKEKAALQKWIDARYEKRESPLSTNLKDSHAILSENLKNGRYIRLNDGSLWEISPEDTPLSQAWITPVEIIVTQSGDATYPYKLTNSVTGTSLRAKKVEKMSS